MVRLLDFSPPILLVPLTQGHNSSRCSQVIVFLLSRCQSCAAGPAESLGELKASEPRVLKRLPFRVYSEFPCQFF